MSNEPITQRLVVEVRNDNGLGFSAEALKVLSSTLRVTPLRRQQTYGSKEYRSFQLELTQRQYESLLPYLKAQGLTPKPM